MYPMNNSFHRDALKAYELSSLPENSVVFAGKEIFEILFGQAELEYLLAEEPDYDEIM